MATHLQLLDLCICWISQDSELSHPAMCNMVWEVIRGGCRLVQAEWKPEGVLFIIRSNGCHCRKIILFIDLFFLFLAFFFLFAQTTWWVGNAGLHFSWRYWYTKLNNASWKIFIRNWKLDTHQGWNRIECWGLSCRHPEQMYTCVCMCSFQFSNNVLSFQTKQFLPKVISVVISAFVIFAHMQICIQSFREHWKFCIVEGAEKFALEGVLKILN